MNWTKEMVDAVKGNDVPHGILKAKCSPVWTWIEQAAKEGAKIDIYRSNGWGGVYAPPRFDAPDAAYRVCSSWQPAPEKTLAETRREFMDAAFNRGNVVRFEMGTAAKYVSKWALYVGGEYTKADMTAPHYNHNEWVSWTWDAYTLTEMTPAEAEADCVKRGGKVPEPTPVTDCCVKNCPFRKVTP